jgi:hypothetical protein
MALPVIPVFHRDSLDAPAIGRIISLAETAPPLPR